MQKTMMILGASKGIGHACAKYFKDKYELITVARTGMMTYNGDIRNRSFLKNLIDTNPQIVINCIGKWGHEPYTESHSLNSSTVIDLMFNLYDTMIEPGHIINLSSLAAVFPYGWKDITPDRINYMSAKSALSAASIALEHSRRRNVRVTVLEPGEIHPTNFGAKIEINNKLYDNFDFNEFVPYRPEDIAETIQWIISTPPWFGISRITMHNHCRGAR